MLRMYLVANWCRHSIQVETVVVVPYSFERLSFIKSKTHWGAAFRFGQLKIPASDFALIAEAMGCVRLIENAL